MAAERKTRSTKFCAAALALLAVFFGFALPLQAGENTRSYDYTYDFWVDMAPSVPVFDLNRTIDKSFFPADINVSGFDDVRTGGGRIFLIDSKEGRLNILDDNFEFVTSVRLLRTAGNRIALDERGRQIILTNPEGVFYYDLENEIYIADTGEQRILVLDGDQYFLKRVISRPEGMTGLTDFFPSKLVVDKAGRIYTVVQSGFEGIIELNADGTFSRYFGINTPKVNLLEYFWRMFATNEQRARMARTFAPAFNNIDIDADGFIYATTHDANSARKVFRLNATGANVLLMSDEFPIEGDFSFGNNQINNQFTAIAINDYGVYAVLDRSQGRIFMYNFFGEMLGIINTPSVVKGGFTASTGIAWHGDYLIATDSQLRRAFVYSMTDFGKLAFDAAKHYYNGEWEASAKSLEQAVLLNGNFDLAYSGIGKYYLMQDDYEKAMYYLKLGQNREFYSKAFNHYRNQWVNDNFFWFILAFVAVVFAVIYTEVRYHKKEEDRKNRGGDGKNAEVS